MKYEFIKKFKVKYATASVMDTEMLWILRTRVDLEDNIYMVRMC
ncbi:hypothetical protein [Methanolobus sp.]|nr:hypothetical protein [Methanolobus sp.]